MKPQTRPFAAAVLLCLLFSLAFGAHVQAAPQTQKRWLFVWRDMNDPKEIDRMIARFPKMRAAGYNGVAFSSNVPPAKAAELRAAAKRNGIDLIAIVMGGSHDRNYVEGLPAKDALFVAHGGVATHQPDNPTRIANGGFEQTNNNKFLGWSWQDDEGVTTFADHNVYHSGACSLRMESIGKNPNGLCRIVQPIKLQPFRQYHISVWLKSEALNPAIPEIKVLIPNTSETISFQTFHTDPTQDWKRCDITFSSMNHTDALIYLGFWGGKSGKLWWDDLQVEEVGLVNVLRRPGCPLTVRTDNGPTSTTYEEGRDFEKLFDPELNPWRAYHTPPIIRLTPNSRIREGERLRVSYYHPIVVYEDRINTCLSEPKIFEEWREEVKQANALLHPAAFLMSHDEIRIINQCALCRSRNMSPGQLLAANVHQAAQIIRSVRPDAEIWVWNDMFDPLHNAVDHFYAVNGSLKGSWKGLDKDVGIVNWHGGLMGKNCKFFADLGLRQILAGYYDGDQDGSAIRQWQENVRGVPGIVGAMYTTWEDRYDAMETWASRAWGTRSK